ncbi:MAG: ATP-binding protein, partial [Nakamurella sp.]
ADRQRLAQVVTNLLSNAIKFNRPGGRVDITCQVSDTAHLLDIAVTDTGCGIPTDDLARLFLPFHRMDADANSIQGTGLGLTLSRDLLMTMGGTLRATSLEGSGSVFTASIPLARTEQEHNRSTPAIRPRPMHGAPTSVLYIEDNATNVGLLEQILAYRPNVTLSVAMLGRVGLEMALKDTPDLILLDLHLPDISGQEVLQRLRADHRTASTPIVILSADAAPDQPQRLSTLGATAYETKPLKVPRILDLIDRLAELRMQPIAAAAQAPIVTITGSPSAAVVDADNSNEATSLSTFRHEMINLLGVVLTYCDLLIGDETKPAKITWLEHQGTATERAIELTNELRVPVPT